MNNTLPLPHQGRARPISLEALPGELLQLIVTYLSTIDLKSVALVNQTLYRHATDVLWQNVCLVDQWKLHVDEELGQDRWSDRGRGDSDEHDDTPILQKLYILARNPTIASKVQTITHRCHLNPPNIFDELPRVYTDAPNLSRDARLYRLLAIAVQNLVSVHTLRIVHGHWRLTNALIALFLHSGRSSRVRVPVRKLWLESCSASVDPMQFLSPTDTTGLESIRVRRLASESLDGAQARGISFPDYRLTRGGLTYQIHNGAGNWVGTTVSMAEQDLPETWPRYSPEELIKTAEAYDHKIWENLPEISEYLGENSDLRSSDYTQPRSAVEPLRWLMGRSASTLTSLNLDWILWRRKEDDTYDHANPLLIELSELRFPHLKAIQIRNAVLHHTRLPDNIYLFELFLAFFESHPKIQCLGWPLDRFYGHDKAASLETQNRQQRLVAHMSAMLIDLRVDSEYGPQGEPLTDQSRSVEEKQHCIRRRRFITSFAPHLRKVEQIKIEGGVPRDEKREILRALHWCPLKKIVMIGVSFPGGNTWGDQGYLLQQLDPGNVSDYDLEEENLEGILAAYRQGFHMSEPFTFEPNFDWPAQAPLLQTIALHHASTVEELKMCGYNGCPILSYQTPITMPLLSALREYHNLKTLVMSFWLLTWFEDSYRDSEIIQSWLDVRSPASTALVVVTPPASPIHEHLVDPGHFPSFNNPRVAPRAQNFNRWAVELKTRLSPSALAYRVAQDIAPYLSQHAKDRPGGVRVRAGFCLGAREHSKSANDIFDLDIRIGTRAGVDQVLEFIGPREEGEKGRWWSKLENRRWF